MWPPDPDASADCDCGVGVPGNDSERAGGDRKRASRAVTHRNHETVTYVSNIYKYYVTYLLIQGEYIQRQAIKKDR
jgi:hypothetical protein